MNFSPAVALRPGKALPDQQVRWKALPAELHGWISTYTATLALQPRQPLFPRANNPAETTPRAPESLTRILSGSRTHPGLLPRRNGSGYSAHTLRHLAAQLAHTTATNAADAPTAEAIVAALLDHTHGRDPLGYLDTTSEPQRELLARHATHAIWNTLRRPQHNNDSTLAKLRNRRHTILTQQPTTTPDKLDTLIHAATLTAQIDDTLASANSRHR